MGLQFLARGGFERIGPVRRLQRVQIVDDFAVDVLGGALVSDVGDQVKRLIPGASVNYTGEVGNDPRNYRVKFDLLSELLPDFQLQYTLASGMEALCKVMRDRGFNAADFEGDRFVRLRALSKKLDTLAA